MCAFICNVNIKGWGGVRVNVYHVLDKVLDNIEWLM